jgi:TonB family protein
VPEKVMAARLLTTVTPEAPAVPKCSNRMVTLDVVIGEDGKVSSLKVLGGFAEFKQSALPAVKQWTYKPYLENGIPTSVETTVQVFYPSTGKPGLLFVPDGKGGIKGGDFLSLPPEWDRQSKSNRQSHNSRHRPSLWGGLAASGASIGSCGGAIRKARC